MAKTRLNIQLEESTHEWVKKQAEAFGISASGFINVAIAQYKVQCEAMKTMQDLPSMMKMLKEMNK